MPIVYALEEIDVHHQHVDSRRIGQLRSLIDLLVQFREQAAPRAQTRKLIALRHLMKLLLKLSFKFVEQRILDQMASDFYFVSVLKQLLRAYLGAVEERSVG